MFYVWIHFEEKCLDFYLPDSENWNGKLEILQQSTGWDADVIIPVRALEGRWFMQSPPGYGWMQENGQAASGEQEMQSGLRVALESGGRKLSIVLSDYAKEHTVFRKYLLETNPVVTIGRDPGNVICFHDPLMSKQHGTLRREGGSYRYRDSSTNASFINRKRLHQAEAVLQFGDVICIPTGLKLIYLGDMLAVNQPAGLEAIRLPQVEPRPAPEPAESDQPPASAVLQLARQPRMLSKVDPQPQEIEAPIAKGARNDTPLILTLGPSMTMMLPMLMGSVLTAQGASSGLMSSGIVMMSTSSVLAVTWALVNSRYRKNQERKTEQKRISLYRAYIQETEKTLAAMKQREEKRLLKNYLSMGECMQLLEGKPKRLWERMPVHPDFMELRMGLGKRPLPHPINIPKERLSIIDDPLRDEPKRLEQTYGSMEKVPITLNLRMTRLTGILGRSSAGAVAMSMIVQLVSLHSYHDVKIVLLCEEKHYSRWEWARWLPHVFPNEDRNLRMVVHGDAGLREVLGHLDEVIAMRRGDTEEAKQTPAAGEENQPPAHQPLPHYVVFCMNPELLDSEAVLSQLVQGVLGFSLVVGAPTMEQLPKECTMLINTAEESPGLFALSGDVQRLDFERVSTAQVRGFSKKLAPYRVKDATDGAAIPSIVSFLEIYGVTDTKDLDVWRFWHENHAWEGLRSTIGLRAGAEPFVLDISDKYHGPHGLVAGTTGSGKSVMLQTYILSLALNYHPEQVQFILIDYKGGGMADAFQGLPHVAGTIDNLQGPRSIQRALASIQGEIHRRESLFKEAGVTSIDDYIRYYNEDAQYESLAHLIIVVDEFAELKKEQPEFMRELVSASRVGRSVGLHLILATQKPSNSVDDEIWSNTRFRICLRVAARADSMDMLKRPEAAYIKGMGRCYVQIGSDELFDQVQTSWSGATYDPTRSTVEEKPYLLGNAGQRIRFKSAKAAGAQQEKTQMDAVLERMNQVVREHGVAAARKLWLDEMTATVFLEEIDAYRETRFEGGWKRPEARELQAVVALGDDMQYQRHIPVMLDFLRHRNHLIVGQSGTGKTTFLQTIAMSLASRYTPSQVQMYIFSLSSKTLMPLAELPHVGDIVYDEELQEIARMVHMLQQESERRRQLFTRAATDSFVAYQGACAEDAALEQVPAIVVLVDRMAQMTESLGEEDKQLFYTLLREGSSSGVFFVVTAMASNEVYSRVRDCFRGVALQLHERIDYLDVLGKRMPSEMADIADLNGRGLVLIEDGIYEMQVALFGDSAADNQRARQIREAGQAMRGAWTGPLPAALPRIPEKPTWAALAERDDLSAEAFPFGYDQLMGVPVAVDLMSAPAWLVTGGDYSGRDAFLQGVCRVFAGLGATVHIVGDAQRWPRPDQADAFRFYRAEDEALAETIQQIHDVMRERAAMRTALKPEGEAAQKACSRGFAPIVLVVEDLPGFAQQGSEEMLRFFTFIVDQAKDYGLYLFVTADSDRAGMLRSRPIFEALRRQGNGVAMGGRMQELGIWDISQMEYTQRNLALPELEGFLARRGEMLRLQVPGEWGP